MVEANLDIRTVGRTKEPSKRQIAKWDKIKPTISQVDWNLFLSGFPDEEMFDQLRIFGIRSVISCTLTPPPDLIGVGSIRYVLRVPFEDDVGNLPDKETMELAVIAALDKLEQDERVLIHCMYGLNRSALVAGTVMAARHPEMLGADIVKQIKERRSGALHNPLYSYAVSQLNPVD